MSPFCSGACPAIRMVRLNGTPCMHVIEHTYVSLLADVANLTGYSEIRGSYEGLQWCLHEAPKLEKYILGCVETGSNPDLDIFPVWLRRLAKGSLVDPLSMRYLRQLLLFCYKASVTHDNKTTEKSFRAFLETNLIVGNFGSDLARVSPALLDNARRHVQSVLYRFRTKKVKHEKKDHYGFLPYHPSHGPGAVTTDKDRWQHLYSTIETVFPYSDWYSLCQNRDHLSYYDSLEEHDIIKAKLIAVPKDSRGPRLICVHPAEAIWVQQAVRRELERSISLFRSSPGPWPKGRIQFDDQTSNGSIALCSSRSRRYATIDMKEASDRISEPLVQILFGSKYKYFGCCRAQKFVIPKYGSHKDYTEDLHSYAPMGNATTFPVQSLVFWAICVASLQRQGFHQPGAVFVFGDDIIIPSECAEEVINDLESFGLLVNRTKSFWRGAFRESCGVDAFNGVNVTPVRWKTTVDAEYLVDLQSLSDIAMRLRKAGYEEAAVTTYQTLRRRLRSVSKRDLFLTNNPDHGGIAEYTTCDSSVWRDAYWHLRFQWFHTPVWRLEEIGLEAETRDWNHVLESVCNLERRKEPYTFERTGCRLDPEALVSRPVRLNRGWIPVK